MVKIKGRQMKSVDDARKSSKGGGGKGFINFIPEDGILVRLLAEPDGWWGYDEHYDADLGYYPCTVDDCVGCDNGTDKSFRYLVPALDIEEDRVIALKVPKSLASEMVSKYDRRKTVMDRDYFFYKEGSGMNNTKYKVDDEEKSRINLSKYEDDIPDLGEVLEEAWARVFDDDDSGSNDDDDDDRPRRSTRGAAKKAGSKKRAPAKKAARNRTDDDEPRRRVPAKKAGAAKKASARKTSARRTVRR